MLACENYTMRVNTILRSIYTRVYSKCVRVSTRGRAHVQTQQRSAESAGTDMRGPAHSSTRTRARSTHNAQGHAHTHLRSDRRLTLLEPQSRFGDKLVGI